MSTTGNIRFLAKRWSLSFICFFLAAGAEAQACKPNCPGSAKGKQKDPYPEKVKPDPANPKKQVPGPMTQAAMEKFDKTNAALETERATGTAALNSTPNSGLCTAGNCDSALNAATAATRAAQSMITTANQRQRQAEQEQQNILATIARGATTGQYQPQHVSDLQNTFEGSSRPTDPQIERLHPNIQDGAFALRTNQDEIKTLESTREEYARVLAETSGIGRKLNVNQERNGSLGQGVNGNRNAAYPSARRGMGSGAGPNSGSNNSSLTSRGDDLVDADRYPQMSNGNLQRNGGGVPGPGGGPTAEGKSAGDKNLAKGDAKGAEGNDKEDGEKKLNSEGKALLAGMLKELQGDLQNPGAHDNLPPPVKGPNGELGSPIVERGLASVKDNTLLGGAILSITKEATTSLRMGFIEKQPIASNTTLNDLDILGIDKSLFKRVNDAIRKKSAVEGGLQ